MWVLCVCVGKWDDVFIMVNVGYWYVVYLFLLGKVLVKWFVVVVVLMYFIVFWGVWLLLLVLV